MTNNTIPNVPREPTIERDVFGTMHIKLGDFDFIQIQYKHPYTDNASTKALAERIAALLSAPSPAGVDGLPEFLTPELEERGREAVERATQDGCNSSRGLEYAYGEAVRKSVVDDAQAIIDGLRVDAERYRALRHSLSGQQHCSHTEMPCISDPISPFVTYTPDGLDAAIDAALSAGKEGE